MRVMNTTLVFLQGLGVSEILMISLFILLFFGAKKIPEFMKGMGKGIREFRTGMKEITEEQEVGGK
jgi:sec-independent protein translocase protein TatA